MIFTEARFLVFFAAAFAVHWLLRGGTARKLWLLLCSSVFYGAWDWRFLGLLYGTTLLDWCVGLLLQRGYGRPRARKALLVASLAANLGTLGLFKYFDFFATSAMALGRWLGIDVGLHTLHLILPVGISFYTFQSLSYTIDVYRGTLRAERSLLDFALFVSFFPQLVAGPIVRAADFLPQLHAPRRLADVDFRVCLGLFLVGYVKKACVSDGVAPIVDQVFADPGAHGAHDLWLGVLLYTVRIYCDFSGYSDMAIATAGLFGYRLALNFDFPYLSRSVAEFWRRWHISLSTWFRDYLYVPLGGNRRSRARTYLNLWIVFLLCGLWHGASWTFVVWGLYHGTFLVLERATGFDTSRWPRLLASAYALFVVVIGWVFFRCQTLGDALVFLRGMVPGGSTDAVIDPAWWLVLPLFAAAHYAAWKRSFVAWWRSLPAWQASLAYGAAVALILPFVASDYRAFIYFQF